MTTTTYVLQYWESDKIPQLCHWKDSQESSDRSDMEHWRSTCRGTEWRIIRREEAILAGQLGEPN